MGSGESGGSEKMAERQTINSNEELIEVWLSDAEKDGFINPEMSIEEVAAIIANLHDDITDTQVDCLLKTLSAIDFRHRALDTFEKTGII